jgi:hypothetical protein
MRGEGGASRLPCAASQGHAGAVSAAAQPLHLACESAARALNPGPPRSTRTLTPTPLASQASSCAPKYIQPPLISPPLHNRPRTIIPQKFTPKNVEFQSKILARSGLGDDTYLPPGLNAKPPAISMSDARWEFEQVRRRRPRPL